MPADRPRRNRQQTNFYEPANRVPRQTQEQLAQRRMQEQLIRDEERYFGENRDNAPIDPLKLLEILQRQNKSEFVSKLKF